MRRLVNKYSTFQLPSGPASGHAPDAGNPPSPLQRAVVLLTGSTGALGTQLLSHLLGRRSVARVYALNRRNAQAGLWERQAASFTQRGLDPSILRKQQAAGRLVLLEADWTVDGFALPAQTYAEIAATVDQIIHNAWPVNFRMPLSGFETSILGLQRLIQFAIAAPHRPSIAFPSSCSVVRDAPPTPAPGLPETCARPEWAGDMNYSRSKWVAEEILARASEQAGVRTLSVRIWQLTGARNGAWSCDEWLPALARGAPALGCVLALEPDTTASFLSLECGAAVFLELADAWHVRAARQADGARGAVVHMVPPFPGAWNSLAGRIAQAQGVPLVQRAEWTAAVQRLQAAEEVRGA